MSSFRELEFHRSGFGLLPDPEDKDPGTAIFLPVFPGSPHPWRNCTCRASRKKTCGHIRRLTKLVSEPEASADPERFEKSLWRRLGDLLRDGSEPFSDVRASKLDSEGRAILRFTSRCGDELAQYYGDPPVSLRLLERIGKSPKAKGAFSDRAALLEKLSLHLRTAEEHQFNKAGLKSHRQSLEASFSGRLAYHLFREYGAERPISVHPAIDEQSGDFTLTVRRDGAPLLRLGVPRRQVRSLLGFLAREFPGSGPVIHPIPLKSIFRVSATTELDIEVRPVIQALQASGEAHFFERADLEKFRYGDLVYVKELSLLAELEPPGKERKFQAPVSMKLERSQVPSFLDAHRAEIEDEAVLLDDSLRRLKIFSEYDFVELTPQALERSWYWLSVNYGFGNQKISLTELLRARKEGLAYLETPEGWIDLRAPALASLPSPGAAGRADGVRLSAVELLKLTSSTARPVRVQGGAEKTALVERLLALRPSEPFHRPEGLRTSLRPYQTLGVEWLSFLYENQLAGLLCDDMGLGKTHQAMALMVWLRERRQVQEPVLVVCPTTVISHWRNKVREHAPGLTAFSYHSPQRDLAQALGEGNVLITSYGVLRNDVEKLQEVPFALAVFDEIQNLKNRETLSYQAASAVTARMKLGLTGTPIENALSDLKSLFDVVLPGYLGTEAEFAARYGALSPSAGAEPTRGQLRKTASPEASGAFSPSSLGVGPQRQKDDTTALSPSGDGGGAPSPGRKTPHEPIEGSLEAFRRVVSPFILRRLKSAVLDELPEKIEDVRTCALSEDQVKLYRDALSGRGEALVRELRARESPLPYIHVFALLSLLKQICDHPALVHGDVERYEKYQSGKWELFKELLFESLDSGQKVVVFSQYLGMIDMMGRLLSTLDVGFATLTGGTRERGEVIRRFNEDADCRVFLGSLKAGGAGIDLVAGSVVLHYDRWWNAAREDQATDRVYRIGQKRAVQVFKLVTEGTLEEKISAIIERKRKLMGAVVQADDPHLAKMFTREELLEMLQPI